VAGFITQIGEAFAGQGVDAAHLNTVLGEKGGPVETAWTTALASPSAGHAPFVVVAQPNIPVLPMTLFVNKAMIGSPEHAKITWGAAQLGVASGVLDAVHDGVIARELLEHLVLIAAVWVDPNALDADAVYENNRVATAAALSRGRLGELDAEVILAVRDSPINGYYVPKSLRRD
jgi:5,6,7,8-tetrahydromethanopterin hydro-lyase